MMRYLWYVAGLLTLIASTYIALGMVYMLPYSLSMNPSRTWFAVLTALLTCPIIIGVSLFRFWKGADQTPYILGGSIIVSFCSALFALYKL